MVISTSADEPSAFIYSLVRAQRARNLRERSERKKFLVYIYIYIFGPHKASKRGKTDGFLTFNKKAFASQKRREAFRL